MAFAGVAGGVDAAVFASLPEFAAPQYQPLLFGVGADGSSVQSLPFA